MNQALYLHIYNLKQQELLNNQGEYYFKDNVTPFIFLPAGKSFKLEEPEDMKENYFSAVDQYLKKLEELRESEDLEGLEERDENHGQDTSY